MFDRDLNLNLDIQLPNIVKAFSFVFGDNYKDLIDERISNCRIIYYMNEDTYKSYYNFLVDCKIKELRIKFYNEIGLSYDKYKTENSGKVYDENLDLRTLNIRFDPKEDNSNKNDFYKAIQRLIKENNSIYNNLVLELNSYKNSISKYLDKKVNKDTSNYKKYINDNEIIEIIENKQVKVFYTLTNNGENDLVFLHMLCHVISTNNDNMIGIEDEKLTLLDDNHDTLRKFELFNEILTDIFSDEARSYLHSEHIYLCEEKDKCTKKDSNKNTPKELKDLVLPLFEIIPLELKKAYIESNPKIIIDLIGNDNYLRINDIINDTYKLIHINKLDIHKYSEKLEEYNDEIKRICYNINSKLTKKTN